MCILPSALYSYDVTTLSSKITKTIPQTGFNNTEHALITYVQIVNHVSSQP